MTLAKCSDAAASRSATDIPSSGHERATSGQTVISGESGPEGTRMFTYDHA